VEILPTICKCRDGIDVLASESCFGNLIHCVKTQVAQWVVKLDRVRVQVANIGDKWDTPQFVTWALLAL
jgi:hypothetical protein